MRDLRDFKRLYRYCETRNTWPVPDLTPAHMAPIKVFGSLEIPSLTTTCDLADWLLLPHEQLSYMADRHGRAEAHGDMAVNHYHRRLMTKRSGTVRLIEAPKARLKGLQRHILHALLERVPSHTDAYGFVKGRTCLQAASRHVGEAVVVCFDIRDFFPSSSGCFAVLAILITSARI